MRSDQISYTAAMFGVSKLHLIQKNLTKFAVEDNSTGVCFSSVSVTAVELDELFSMGLWSTLLFSGKEDSFVADFEAEVERFDFFF